MQSHYKVVFQMRKRDLNQCTIRVEWWPELCNESGTEKQLDQYTENTLSRSGNQYRSHRA